MEKIRSATARLEQGYLTDASRLTRALSRHPRYVQGREQFLGAAQGCPAEVLAAQVTYGGVGTARRLADEAGPMLAQVLRDGAEDWLTEWLRVMPLVIGVLSWDTTARPWRPVSLTRWPLEAVRVDMTARKLWALTTAGEEEIRAGDGTWVVAWNSGPFDFASGLLRCLGEAWIRGINAGRDVANRSQASGVAAILAQVAESKTMEDSDLPAYEERLQNLQKGGAAGILVPPGYPLPTALDLASKNAMPSLDLALRTSTTDLLVPWLMQDGTATNEGGSLAKAQVLDGVMFSAVQRFVSKLWGEVTADGSHVPGVITSQIVRPWVAYQVGEDVDPDRVCPLALRRVPDLEEDSRLTAEKDRAAGFWAEVEMVEKAMRRDMTEDELQELAGMRGVRVPATVLRERGERAARPEGQPVEETAPLA
ncbi:MAG: hypothetical protein EKK62_03125 [Acidimicrobiia bacterium]|nr:MAG: hypothetical protein EKK62_03125 [Acidimicrobiia bacterium]